MCPSLTPRLGLVLPLPGMLLSKLVPASCLLPETPSCHDRARPFSHTCYPQASLTPLLGTSYHLAQTTVCIDLLALPTGGVTGKQSPGLFWALLYQFLEKGPHEAGAL